MRSMPSASSRCSSRVSRSGLILAWETFLATATLLPRSESHGGGTVGEVADSSPIDEVDEVVQELVGVPGVLAGRAGALGLLRIIGLLGWERVRECVGEGVGDGEEGREREG